MTFLAGASLHQKFVDALKANAAFVTQTQAFDGAVQLEVDGDCLWLKIYKGQVIDHQASPSIFGYTFTLRGSERLWADLTYPGKPDFSDNPNLARVGEMSVDIATEGNLIEAGRLTEAMFELAYTLRAVAA